MSFGYVSFGIMSFGVRSFGVMSFGIMSVYPIAYGGPSSSILLIHVLELDVLLCSLDTWSRCSLILS